MGLKQTNFTTQNAAGSIPMRQRIEQYAPGPAPVREDEQPNLFEQHDKPRATGSAPITNRAAISARKDPITSLLAAQDITLSGARSEKKREMVNFLRTCRDPMTSFEIAMAIGWDRHAAARRLPDARADGLVENGPIRPCRISGRPSITWRVVRA